MVSPPLQTIGTPAPDVRRAAAGRAARPTAFRWP